jgi:hypothetical protein
MNQPHYGAMFYFLRRFKFLYAFILVVTLVVSVPRGVAEQARRILPPGRGFDVETSQ